MFNVDDKNEISCYYFVNLGSRSRGKISLKITYNQHQNNDTFVIFSASIVLEGGTFTQLLSKK